MDDKPIDLIITENVILILSECEALCREPSVEECWFRSPPSHHHLRWCQTISQSTCRARISRELVAGNEIKGRENPRAVLLPFFRRKFIVMPIDKL